MKGFNLSSWALNNTKLVSFVVLCLLLGGIISYINMPKLEDPAIKVKQAIIITTYAGASAHDVELEISLPIENAIRELGSIDNVVSKSMADLSIITAELKTTTKDKDVEQQWDLLRRKIASVALPKGASEPIIKDDFGDVYGLFYALTGNGIDLNKYANKIKQELNNIEGISRVEIYGEKKECIYIDLDEAKLAALSLMPFEIIKAINEHSQPAYSGYLDAEDYRLRLSIDERFTSLKDIEELKISGSGLRLKDIASIYKAEASPKRSSLKRDGEQAIGIAISVISSDDVTHVGKIVEKKLLELQESFPIGIELHKVFYQSDRVSDALGAFVINLAESVLIVVIVLIFTMGIRSGLIIGASLLTIVLGSLLVLNAFDGTLQRVSLASFVLAMGMLVDNAIVIVDGILVCKKQGMSNLQALTHTAGNTAMPLLGATMIAILAFVPIFLSPDTAGVYVRDLFIVVAVSLLLSWILALTHVPIMAKRWLIADHKSIGSADSALYQGKIYAALKRILVLCIDHKAWAIVSAILLLLVSVFGLRYVDRAFFPDMEYDQLYMEYKLNEGHNERAVEKDLNEIEALLMQKPYIKHITSSIGGSPARYNLVRSIAMPSLCYGEMIIDFNSASDLKEHINELQEELSDAYPDAYIKLKRYNLMYKPYPIECCFVGADPAILHELADKAIEIIKQSDKLCLFTTDWANKQPVICAAFNQEKASRAGISCSDAALSLLGYTDGLPVGAYYEGIESLPILVRSLGDQASDIGKANIYPLLPNIRNLDKSDLEDIVVGKGSIDDLVRKTSSPILLSAIVDSIYVRMEEPIVMRYNGQRMQRVQCSAKAGYSTEEARAELESKLNLIDLPEGYSISWEGEKKASDQSMRYLFKGFPMAILMMIAILIMLFKDYKKPIIVFCSIPLLIIGVVFGLLVSGKSLGFVAVVGILGLIGMMIKNGIVLMDEIGRLVREQALSIRDAAILGAQSRLRAVMMSSVTTIVGMIPLLSDAMFGSLAVTIMGGLFVGTIITLIFIPLLYAIFFD